MAVTTTLLTTWILAVTFPALTEAETCFDYDSYYSTYTTIECDNGCCGDYYDKYCCSSVGLIVGAVIGGIILVSLVVLGICCFLKVKGRPGRVITSSHTVPVSTAVVYNNTGYQAYPQGLNGNYNNYPGGGQPMQQYPPPPPPSGMYSEPAYPPPAYNQINQQQFPAAPPPPYPAQQPQ